MYSRRKRLEEAWRVFDDIVNTDLVLWNAMFSLFRIHSGELHGLEAIWAFIEMARRGMKLNNVSFIGAVSCGHHKNLEIESQMWNLQIIITRDLQAQFQLVVIRSRDKKIWSYIYHKARLII
ncbi:hypothetical protein REPUB_Repub03eG0281700 [Reevesia pubescens]